MASAKLTFEVWDDMGLVRRFASSRMANTFAKQIGGMVKRVGGPDWGNFEPAVF